MTLWLFLAWVMGAYVAGYCNGQYYAGAKRDAGGAEPGD